MIRAAFLTLALALLASCGADGEPVPPGEETAAAS